MFERLCILIFRLYPIEFRRTYGRDAWHVIQQRARVERTFALRMRLLLDLARDVIAMLVRGWQPAQELIAAADARDGGPRFQMIEVSTRRPEWFAAGMVTSALMFASFTVLFQPTEYPNAPAQLGEGSGGGPEGFPSKDDQQQAVAGGDDRHALIAAIAANLQQRYYDRAIGRQLADAILAFEKDGRYDKVATGPELAQKITDDIHTTSSAIGIPKGMFVADVVYSEYELPKGPPPPMMPASDLGSEVREYRDCQFSIVEMREGNIGYFKINGFAPGCGATAAKAMASFNDVSALIIDLRDNGGGIGDIALLIAGYLFDRPTPFWDPRPGSPVPPNTASPVAGSKLANTPVYLVTSTRTQSAAEYFAYNLKMLKRVTIVGERTAGHEHAGAFQRVTDHIGMGVQEVAPPQNPYAIKGWEVIGVEPDVQAARLEAPDVAKKLAASRK